MLASIIIAAIFPAIILGHGVIPCGGGLPAPTAIRIEGCPVSPCQVNQNQLVYYQADFVGTASSNSITLGMESTVFDETHVLELPPAMSNVCNNLIVGSCPVTAGQALSKSGVLPVESAYHGGIPAHLRVFITNADNSYVMCSIIHLVIH